MRAPSVTLFGVLVAASAAAGEAPVDYATQVKPLFERHCVTCHGPLRKQGGLRLDAAQFVREGGDSGFTVVAREPASSMLVAALKGEDGVTRMPKDAPPLPAEEIALLERWIAEGANAPDNEPVEGDPAAHWAFQPVTRSAVPVVAGDVKNPIDAFVAARRGAGGIESVAGAPKHVLLRRVYLDLVGMPPGPEELRALLADDSPDAYERLVDRLLADPRHGERWGRHWMDVWRYSDWYGYGNELRNSQKHVWRWRDWIVESINEGKPYDRMVAEMLAADEIAPTDDDALRATGFLARHYYKFNRDVWLDRVVEHTGKAFLGMTFNCARCHDHMFDPVTQREYYSLRSFFEPYKVRIGPIGGVLDENADGLTRAYDAEPETPTYLFVRGNDKQPDKENPVSPVLPAFFVSETAKPEALPLPASAYYPGLRPEVRGTLRKKLDNEVAAADEAVRKTVIEGAVASIGSIVPIEAPSPVPSARAVVEAKLNAARLRRAALEARIAADDGRYAGPVAAQAETLAVAAARSERDAALATADAEDAAARRSLEAARRKPEAERAKAVEAAQKGLDAARKAVESAKAEAAKTDGSYSPLTAVHPATSTGRRTVLVNWITDPANPLAARVAVNHVWMRHFGRPLVATVFDFGMHGAEPTHPELLDWLAAEFVASGWDMKHLHRLIVMSATYRLDSVASKDHPSLAADPDNRLLWRMNPRRAEGEVVRDSLLATSGRLVERLGGAELDSDADQTTTRRSLYYRHAPEKYAVFLQTFDGANAEECYRRAETIVPQQALAQMNSRLSREQSRVIAKDLFSEGESPDGLIAQAFERVLCREATSEERAASASFLAEQESRLATAASLSAVESGPEVGVPAPESPRLRAYAGLVHVLLNHHDFVTIR
jgi:mono/diheme cytochrome c family protein